MFAFSSATASTRSSEIMPALGPTCGWVRCVLTLVRKRLRCRAEGVAYRDVMRKGVCRAQLAACPAAQLGRARSPSGPSAQPHRFAQRSLLALSAQQA